VAGGLRVLSGGSKGTAPWSLGAYMRGTQSGVSQRIFFRAPQPGARFSTSLSVKSGAQAGTASFSAMTFRKSRRRENVTVVRCDVATTAWLAVWIGLTQRRGDAKVFFGKIPI